MKLLLRVAVLLAIPGSLAAQDTLVVRADQPPAWGERPQLVEELRIGVLEGDPAYTIGSVEGFVEAADGSIWVGDFELGAIHRFSATGKALGQVGRKGEGPGEFKYIAGLGLLSTGEIAVADPGNVRLSVFDTTGQYLRAFRLPGPSIVASIPRVPQLRMSAAGEIHWFGTLQAAQVVRPETPPPPGTPLEIRGRSVYGWFRIAPNGEILDTIPRPDTRNEGQVIRIGTHTLMSPLGYLVQGRNDQYALTRPLRDGRVVRIERSWAPVETLDGEREDLQAVLDWGAGGSPPAMKPAWYSFDVDDDGRIWVSRYVEAIHLGETEAQRDRRLNPLRGTGVEGTGGRKPRPPVTWGQPVVLDVIEPTGRYLGTLTLPRSASLIGIDLYSGTRVVSAHDMTVWVVEIGELDESYIVKYRIVPGK